MVTKQRCFEMEWAKIHLDTLNSELARVLSNPDNLYRITTHEHTEHGRFIIESEAIGSIHFLKIGFIAGDYIHNLRSCLDHIAWGLAKIGKARPSSETCFPVCAVNRPSTDAKISAATVGIPAEAISIMKSLQPYHYGKAYKSHPLWRLNFLWNANKHRVVGLHSSDSGVLYEIPRGIPVEERRFHDGTIVAIPLSAKDKVRFYPRPNGEVLFGDEERGIQLTIQDLRDIYEFVRSKVVTPLITFLP
jgi:hypothetical protein